MYTLSIYFLENPFFRRKKGPPIYKTEKLRKTCLKILFTGVPCHAERALVALQQHKSSNALHHLDQVVPYIVFYKTILLVEIH